jgi:hypothetical protein
MNKIIYLVNGGKNTNTIHCDITGEDRNELTIKNRTLIEL